MYLHSVILDRLDRYVWIAMDSIGLCIRLDLHSCHCPKNRHCHGITNIRREQIEYHQQIWVYLTNELLVHCVQHVIGLQPPQTKVGKAELGNDLKKTSILDTR
jgi:hypothetical protein